MNFLQAEKQKLEGNMQINKVNQEIELMKQQISDLKNQVSILMNKSESDGSSVFGEPKEMPPLPTNVANNIPPEPKKEIKVQQVAQTQPNTQRVADRTGYAPGDKEISIETMFYCGTK